MYFWKQLPKDEQLHRAVNNSDRNRLTSKYLTPKVYDLSLCICLPPFGAHKLFSSFCILAKGSQHQQAIVPSVYANINSENYPVFW